METNTFICLRIAFGSKLTVKEIFFSGPLCPHSSMTFLCPGNKKIKICVYNEANNMIRTIVNDTFAPGIHHVVWDGTDDNGEAVGCGTYTIRCSYDKFMQSQKIIKLQRNEVSA